MTTRVTRTTCPLRHGPARTRRAALSAVVALSVLAAACTFDSPGRPPAVDYAAIVAAPDRAPADRAVDARRAQPRLLAFTGARPGMAVLDVAAGGGYSTELLARAVAPDGVVWAQEPPTASERARTRLGERLATPATRNVRRVVRPFDDPVPPEAGPLDLVTLFFNYHDISYLPVDRAAMNRKVFAALKPGGHYVIADHSARAGDGVGVAKTLHRIEEAALRREVEAAGFRLVESGDFLRRPEDPRDKPIGGDTPADEFVLRFVKPR